MTRLLEVANLCASYGASQILRGVDLRVGEGEIVSLLGRNGSGRSTTAKAIMGMVERRGLLKFNGTDLSRLQAWQIARAGIGYVPETRDIFPALTVAENLALGVKRDAGRGRIDDCYDLFPLLKARARTHGGVLSGGEQQILALARAWMGDPRLLIVDEPAEGLDPRQVSVIAAALAGLRGLGVAILLIEQKLDIALKLSQRVYVLGHGRAVFEGSPEQLRTDLAGGSVWLTL